MNGIEYIAKILKDEGVEWMACCPSNPLIEAVAKEGIRPIAFRHERGAVMAADGFSRVSGPNTFGVVMMQSQAGAEEAMQVLSASISEFAERLSEFSDAQAELAPALNHLAGPLELRLVPRRDTASPETTSDDV